MAEARKVNGMNPYETTYEYDRNAVRSVEPARRPEQNPVTVPQRLPQPVTRPAPEEAPRRRISLLYVAALVLGVILFSSIISMRGELTELAIKTYDLKTDILSLQKEQSALQLALNEQMTQVELEDYAVNTLGMVKATDASISYLRYHNDAEFEINENADTDDSIWGLVWGTVRSGAEKVWSFIN